MLRDYDLSRFRDYFHMASSAGQTPADPASVLESPGGLFSEELWRLAQSLQIAAVIGDADPLEAIAANLIARQVREIRCADFDHSIPWQQAIAWALAQLTEVAQGNPRQGFADRSRQVGQACRRLRDKGYQISITAYGVSVSEQSQRDIIARTDGLIADFGGVEAAMRICRLMYLLPPALSVVSYQVAPSSIRSRGRTVSFGSSPKSQKRQLNYLP
jgi:hypothetical protein